MAGKGVSATRRADTRSHVIAHPQDFAAHGSVEAASNGSMLQCLSNSYPVRGLRGTAGSDFGEMDGIQISHQSNLVAAGSFYGKNSTTSNPRGTLKLAAFKMGVNVRTSTHVREASTCLSFVAPRYF